MASEGVGTTQSPALRPRTWGLASPSRLGVTYRWLKRHKMLLLATVPVLVYAMIDTDKAQPTGQKIPNIRQIGIKIGTPLDFSRYEGMEGDRFVLRSITDELMYELMQLSDQEYVDMYATSMKEKLLTKAKRRARELQEAARPGRAVPELEQALEGDGRSPAAGERPADPWSEESRDGL